MARMTRVAHEMKLVYGQLVADHVTLMTDNYNHGTITNDLGCLFDGYAPEAYQVYETEKDRLQKIADDFKDVGGRLEIIK